MNLEQIIEAAADRAAKKTINELRRRGMLRENSFYKRTETLLRSSRLEWDSRPFLELD